MPKKMTTEEFIQKAKAVHGDKYDYSKVDMDNRDEKGRVCIVCKKHGEFLQIPHEHFKGYGCKQCGYEHENHITLGKSAKEHLENIKQQYPQWIFENEPKRVDEKITGYCEKHSKHFSLTISYFNGKNKVGGCPECMGKRSHCTIEENLKTIQNKYPQWNIIDIPKTVSDVLKCECMLHGPFTLSIAGFPKHGGCPDCVGRKRHIPMEQEWKKIKEQYPQWTFENEPKTKENNLQGYCNNHSLHFGLKIENFPKHGGCPKCMNRNVIQIEAKHQWQEITKQYPQWSFENEPKTTLDKVSGVCQIHNRPFTISISGFNSNKNGGCPYCMHKHTFTVTEEDAKKRWIEKHQEGDVKLVKWNGMKDKSIFICSKHGEFSAVFSDALDYNNGCPVCGKGFTKSYVLSLIDKMDLMNMDEQDLFEIISMKRLPNKFNVLLNSHAGSKERANSINELKKSIKNQSEEEFEKEIEQGEQLEESENNVSSNENTSEIKVNGDEDEDAIVSLDSILSSISGMDKANIFIGEGEKFLVTRNINRIWNLALKADENNKLKDFINDFKSRTSSGKWFDYIRNGFFNEYNTVISIKKDNDCVFPYEPNLMQKLMVFKGMTNANYGNWCGTGTGKSFARDLLSRAIDARVSVYIVPNSTVKQTVKELLERHYKNPSKCVLAPKNPSDIYSMDVNKHNYIVLNYDKFNQYNTSEWINAIISRNPKIDFICLDEVQDVKVRDDKNASSRYQNVLAFVTKIREINTNVKVLAMSATPIVINLTEVVKLLNLLTGYDYSNEIGKQMTYANVHNAYKALVLNGFRYLKKYEEIKQNPIEFVPADGSELLDELLKVNIKQGVLPVEKILLPKKLEAIKDRICSGTILYIEYVDHGKFIPIIRDFLDKQGITSVTYIGNDDKDTRDDNLKKFKEGKVQTIILSSTGSTGLDGLQKKGHQIIALSLPWTSAEMEQLKGRIIRTGYEAGSNVSIIIPQVVVKMPNGKEWSWDKRRWSTIENRQTRGEMVMDGNFKSVKEYDEKTVKSILLNNAIKQLQEGLVDKNAVREHITSDKVSVVEFTRKNPISVINDAHQKANTCKHENISRSVFGDSQEKFREYHKARRMAIQNHWVSDPIDKVAEIIGKYKERIYENIIDLGCGENLLKTKIHNGEKRVVGVDVQQIDDGVVKGDCANLKGIIEDESKQIAVHCLSLWGTNYMDCIKEDYRILESGINSPLIIVEPSDKFGENGHFGTIDDFVAKVEEVGFRKNGNVETENGFCFFRFTK